MATKEKTEKMPIVNPNAAGIDVGGRSHYVAVNQNPKDVRVFGVYTEDLHLLAQWLVEIGITTVSMESTGDYWRSLFIILQYYGSAEELIFANA